MKASPEEFEQQARIVRDGVQRRLEIVEDYGRPLVQKYGKSALAVGMTGLAVVGIGMMVARRRRRRSFRVRIQDSVSSRMERPISSVRSVAGRFSR